MDSEDERSQASEALASKFLFPIEQTEDLLLIGADSGPGQDLLCQRLPLLGVGTYFPVFLVHPMVKDIILCEWKTPENKLVFFWALRRRFPFDADSAGFHKK